MTMPDASFSALRPAGLEDLATLEAIDQRCFPRGIAYPKEEIAALLRARSALTLVAERAGVVAGFASMRLLQARRSPPPPRRGELITIDVLPEFRRARVGWDLYAALEDWLRANGGQGIELNVAVDNLAALRFYQRLGYTVVARVPRYYLQSVDAWRMEKSVS